VDDEVFKMQSKKASPFANWLPGNVFSSMCDVPPKGLEKGATFIGNSVMMATVLKRQSEKFFAMFQKKAFVHWYTAEGVEEAELTEADSNIRDLVSDYQLT
jgi:tubulin beta